jgi:hypothetical protein
MHDLLADGWINFISPFPKSLHFFAFSVCAQKNLGSIIQVLDFMNKLFSSKFQVPGPGTLVGERGT